MYKLEDRILFDGAAVADVADAQQEAEAQQQEAAEAEEAAQQEAAENAENTDSSEGSESNGDSSAAGDSDDPGSLESILAAIETGNAGADGEHVNVLIVSDTLENVEDIINATSSDTIVVRYDARSTSAADLLQQLTDALDGSLADSIGFVTESGENSTVQLFADTGTSLDTVNNSIHQAFFNYLDSLMSEGAQLNLFDSNLASTTEGMALVDAISDALDHDVAASIDKTGSESFGGDWILEYTSHNGLAIDDDNPVDLISTYFEEHGLDDFDSLLEEPNNVIFVNSSVEDADTLISEISDQFSGSADIIYLSSDNAMAEMADYFSSHSGIDSVYIVTDGNQGYFYVGDTQVNFHNIAADYQNFFTSWSSSLSEDADIMLYSCNTADSAAGHLLISELAAYTGADVAASTNTTGEGGDWTLEYSLGHIDAASLNIDGYMYSLDSANAISLVIKTLDDKAVVDTPDIGSQNPLWLREALYYTNKYQVTEGYAITFAARSVLISNTTDPTTDGRTIHMDTSLGEMTIGGTISVDGSIHIDGSSYTWAIVDGGYDGLSNSGVRQLVVNTGADATLAMIELAHGEAYGTGADANGGSIYIYAGATVTLSDVSIIGSHADGSGGAIFNAGDLSIVSNGEGYHWNVQNFLYSGNSANLAGGAVYNEGALTIQGDSTAMMLNFWFNDALSGDGGAVYSRGSCYIYQADFWRNTASGDGGAVYITNQGDTTFTFTVFENNAAAGNGGGLYFSGNSGDLHLNAAYFTDNSADDNGGGIYFGNNNGDLYLCTNYSYVDPDGKTVSVQTNVPSTYSGNTADANGGAIYMFTSGALYVDFVRFEDNTAGDNGLIGGNGGAIYVENSGAITLTDVNMFGNSANDDTTSNVGGNGGAIYVSSNTGSDVDITTSCISSNTASHDGAGAYITYTTTAQGDVSITNSTIAYNNATGNGDGIYVNNAATVDLYFNTFAYNRGEAFYIGGAPGGNETLLMVLNNIVYNDDYIYTPTQQAYLDANVLILNSTNNIFSHYYTFNTDAKKLADTSDLTEQKRTLADGSILTVGYTDASSNWVGLDTGSDSRGFNESQEIQEYLYLDTTLRYHANYRTQALSLLYAQSIAYTAGVYVTGITHDQRGNTRIGLGADGHPNFTPSIGAFEPIYYITVNSKGDDSTLLWSNDQNGRYIDNAYENGFTLREATYWLDTYTEYADGIGYVTVDIDRYVKFNSSVFTPGDSTITLTNGQILIGGTIFNNTFNKEIRVSVTPDGTWLADNTYVAQDSTSRIVVDGSGSNRIFAIASGSTARISNLTLQNGKAMDGISDVNSNGQAGWGGAIYNDGSTYLNNVVVQDSLATDTGTATSSGKILGLGGGIYNDSGAYLYMYNSTVTSNDAISVASSKFPINEAGLGGGIYNAGTMYILESAISSNTASGNITYANNSVKGGGIYNTGSLTIVSSTINNNTLTATQAYLDTNLAGEGAAIYNEASADLTMYYTTVVYNKAVLNASTPVTDETSVDAIYSAIYFAGTTANSLDISYSIIAQNSAYLNSTSSTKTALNDIYVDAGAVDTTNAWSANYNIIGNASHDITTDYGFNWSSVANNETGTAATGDVAANFATTAEYNGGKTQNFRIYDGSYAYTGGSDSSFPLSITISYIGGVTSTYNITTDQRGASRSQTDRTGSTRRTIGAYEALTEVYVTSSEDTGITPSITGFDFTNNRPGFYSDSVTVRDAFYWADPEANITIRYDYDNTFAATVNLAYGQIAITKGVDFHGDINYYNYVNEIAPSYFAKVVVNSSGVFYQLYNSRAGKTVYYDSTFTSYYYLESDGSRTYLESNIAGKSADIGGDITATAVTDAETGTNILYYYYTDGATGNQVFYNQDDGNFYYLTDRDSHEIVEVNQAMAAGVSGESASMDTEHYTALSFDSGYNVTLNADNLYVDSTVITVGETEYTTDEQVVLNGENILYQLQDDSGLTVYHDETGYYYFDGSENVYLTTVDAGTIIDVGGTITEHSVTDGNGNVRYNYYTVKVEVGESEIDVEVFYNHETASFCYLTEGSEISAVYQVTAVGVDHTGYSLNNGRIFYADNSRKQITEVGLLDMTLQNGVAADASGGAIYSTESLYLSNVTVTHNSATGTEDGTGLGGGIYVIAGNLTLSESTVSYNTADNQGGGFYSVTGNVYIGYNYRDAVSVPVGETYASILYNNAGVSGGGGVIVSAPSVTVAMSAIGYNTAGGAGGGLFLDNSNVTMVNTTISDNTSGLNGGGIGATGGSLNLNYVTIANNVAGTESAVQNGGGGIYQSSGSLAITNSILSQNWSNEVGDTHNDYYAGGSGVTITTADYNVIGATNRDSRFIAGTGNLVESNGDYIWNELGLDTKLEDNGGNTWTVYVQKGSVAIDVAQYSPLVPTDQRDVSRDHGTGTATAGAYEKPTAEESTYYYVGTDNDVNEYANWELQDGTKLTEGFAFPDLTFVFDLTHSNLGGVVTISADWITGDKTVLEINSGANITIDASSTVEAALYQIESTAALTVNDGIFTQLTNLITDLAGTLTINADGHYSGNVALAGALIIAAADGNVSSMGISSATATSYTTYNATVDQSIKTLGSGNYGNLYLGGADTTKRYDGGDLTAQTLHFSNNNITLDVTAGGLTVNTGGSDSTGASIELTGDLTINSGSQTDYDNTGLVFKGTSAQTITTDTARSFSSITVSNAAGVELTGSNAVDVDTFEFTSGSFMLNAGDLTINNNGGISGDSGADGRYFITAGDGSLVQKVLTAADGGTSYILAVKKEGTELYKWTELLLTSNTGLVYAGAVRLIDSVGDVTPEQLEGSLTVNWDIDTGDNAFNFMVTDWSKTNNDTQASAQGVYFNESIAFLHYSDTDSPSYSWIPATDPHDPNGFYYFGHDVTLVTNNNDSGSGSLRAAMNSITVAGVVVFDNSSNFNSDPLGPDLDAHVRLTTGDITVAAGVNISVVGLTDGRSTTVENTGNKPDSLNVFTFASGATVNLSRMELQASGDYAIVNSGTLTMTNMAVRTGDHATIDNTSGTVNVYETLALDNSAIGNPFNYDANSTLAYIGDSTISITGASAEFSTSINNLSIRETATLDIAGLPDGDYSIAGALDVAAGATLTTQTVEEEVITDTFVGSFTVAGDTDVSGNLILSSTSNLVLQGADNKLGTFTAAIGSTVTYAGTSAQIGDTVTYYNLTVNSGSTVNFRNTGTAIINGTLYSEGTIGFNGAGGDLVLKGNATFGKFNYGTSTVSYLGGDQIIDARNASESDIGVEYYNLVLGGGDVVTGATKSITEDLTINNNFTVNNYTTMQVGTQIVIITGDYTVATEGAFKFTDDGYLYLGGSVTADIEFTDGYGTVVYNGNSSQTIASGSYNNLQIENGDKILVGDVTVLGNFLFDTTGSGRLLVDDYNITINGSIYNAIANDTDKRYFVADYAAGDGTVNLKLIAGAPARTLIIGTLENWSELTFTGDLITQTIAINVFDGVTLDGDPGGTPIAYPEYAVNMTFKITPEDAFYMSIVDSSATGADFDPLLQAVRYYGSDGWEVQNAPFNDTGSYFFGIGIPDGGLVVTTDAATGQGSLAWAIAAANFLEGTNYITFSKDFFFQARTITLTSELNITDTVVIEGLGTDLITVSGNNSSRVFNIDNSLDNKISVSISGMTITKGVAANGGAIYNNEILYLENVEVTDSAATTVAGGGIYNSGTLYTMNVTIAHNVYSGIYNTGDMTLYNTTITGSIEEITIVSGTVKLFNLTLAGSNSGDTLHIFDGADVEIYNTIIAGDITGTFTGTNNYLGYDMFVGGDSYSLADNGGWVRTIAIINDSTVVDAGLGYNDGAYNYDARGYLTNGSKDIGAYEYNGYVAQNIETGVYYSSISDAVAAAGGGEEIQLVDTRVASDSTLTISQDIYITGSGDAWSTVLARTGTGNILTIGSTSDSPAVTLYNLGLRGGDNASGNGGAIVNYGSLHLYKSVVSDSSAAYGGGIYNMSGAYLGIEHSMVAGNTATVDGGGIYNLGTAYIVNSTIQYNTADNGGGIYNGAGSAPASLRMENSTINNNIATIDGGGIYSKGTFHGENSTIYANTATNNGGGIYLDSGTATFMNMTVAYNIADKGGGVYIDTNANLTSYNSIIAYNTTTDTSATVSWNDLYSYSTNNYSADHNLIGYYYINSTGYEGNFDYGSDSLFSGHLADNGGWTKTIALAADSVAIDAGNYDISVSADQRGYLTNGTRDIGAYESDGYIGYIIFPGSSVDKTSSYYVSSIQEAFSYFLADTKHAENTLYLVNTRIKESDITAELTYSVKEGDKTVYKAKTITIVGSSEGGTVISAGGAGRVFILTSHNVTGGTLVVNNVQLADGINMIKPDPVADPDASNSYGGAVYMKGANIVLNDSAIVNSLAGRDGGAVYAINDEYINSKGSEVNIKASITLNNSYLGSNRSGRLGGALAGTNAMTIKSSTLYDNISGGSGGAIAVTGTSTLDISNSTVAWNRAITPSSGGIFVSGGDSGGAVTSENTLIARNYQGLNPDRDAIIVVSFSTGETVPVDTEGNNGDTYVVANDELEENGNIYIKTAGEWVLTTNLTESNAADIITGTVNPTTETEGGNGDYYVNTTDGTYWVMDATNWIPLTEGNIPVKDHGVNIGPNESIGFGTEPPTDSTTGDYYLDTTTGICYENNLHTTNKWDPSSKYSIPIGGKTIRPGTTDPEVEPDDKNGDFYLNTSTGQVYLMSNGLWRNSISTVGGADSSKNTTGMDYYYVTGKLTDKGYNLVEYQNGNAPTSEDVDQNYFGAKYTKKDGKTKVDMHDIVGSKEYIFATDKATDNGGWSWTLELASNSAALNKGTGSEADQRGYGVYSTADIGAYELFGTVATNGSNSYSSIQAAIDDASSGDTITLNSTRILEHDIQLNKSLNITGTSGSGLLYGSVVDGGHLGRVMMLKSSGNTVNLSNMVVTGGYAMSSSLETTANAAGNGGAIFSNSTLTLTDVQVRNSFAQRSGGGVYSANGLNIYTGANNAIDFSTGLYGNTAGVAGGAVFVQGGLNVKGVRYNGSSYSRAYFMVQFHDNSAWAGGGALSVQGSANMQYFHIQNNDAMSGGAASFTGTGSSSMLADYLIEDNYAFNNGGALYVNNYGDITLKSNGNSDYIHGASHYNVRIRNNFAAGDGGGIYMNNSGTVSITSQSTEESNSTPEVIYVQSNTAYGKGGGIYFANSQNIDLGYYVDISNNTANSDGGGIYFSGSNNIYLTFACHVDYNLSYGDGGGIYMLDSNMLSTKYASSISSNYTLNSGVGGGLYAENVTTIDMYYTSMNSNYSYIHGAGMYLKDIGSVALNDVDIYQSQRTEGIYALGDSNITIKTSGVSASGGTGIWVEKGTLTLENVTVADNNNWYTSGVGGIYLGHGTLDMNFCTVVGNYGGSGTASISLGEDGVNFTSNISIVNSIVQGEYEGYFVYFNYDVSFGTDVKVVTSHNNIFTFYSSGENNFYLNASDLVSGSYSTIYNVNGAEAGSRDGNNNIVGHNSATITQITENINLDTSLKLHANFRSHSYSLLNSESIAYGYYTNSDGTGFTRTGRVDGNVVYDQRGNLRSGVEVSLDDVGKTVYTFYEKLDGQWYKVVTTEGENPVYTEVSAPPAPSVGAFEPLFYTTVTSKTDESDSKNMVNYITTNPDANNVHVSTAIINGLTLREAVYWIDSYNPDDAVGVTVDLNRYVKFSETLFTSDGNNTISLQYDDIFVKKDILISITPGYGGYGYTADNTYMAQNDSARITVDGGNTSRIFYVESGWDVVISNLTITDGYVAGFYSGGNVGYGGGQGGAIFNTGNLTLNNVVVKDSSATNSHVTGGTYLALGGGVYNDSGATLTLNDTTITGNSVTGNRNSDGDNNVGLGGGIYNNGGTVTINTSLISGNTANGFNFDKDKASGTSAGLGGGIYNHSGTLNITNSTITENALGDSTSKGGSAIYVRSGSITLYNNTIVNNAVPADQGSGDGIPNMVVNKGSAVLLGDGVAVTMVNNIIANNRQTGSVFIGRDLYVSGVIGSMTESHNIIGAYRGNFTPDSTDKTYNAQQGVVYNLNLSSDLAYLGGKTMSYRVLANSVAIGNGTFIDSVTGDQRGNIRPASSWTIGSYELLRDITINVNTDPVAIINNDVGFDFTGNQAGWLVSLRTAAFLDDAGTVTIDPATWDKAFIGLVYGGMKVTGFDVTIKTKEGETTVTIDGSNSGRIFNIDSASPIVTSATLSNLILQNAYAGSQKNDLYIDVDTGMVYIRCGSVWTSVSSVITTTDPDTGEVTHVNAVLSKGVGAPDAGTENNYYLDVATGNVYQKNADTKAWSIYKNADGTNGIKAAYEPKIYVIGDEYTTKNGDYLIDQTTGELYQMVNGTQTLVKDLTDGFNEALYYGTAAPTTDTGGKNGDVYVNTKNGDVYQMANNSWGDPIANNNIIGNYFTTTGNGAPYMLNGSGTPALGNGNGGAIYSHENLTLNNVTVQNNNAANSGGGIYVTGANLTLTDATSITGNNAENQGGGIYINAGTLTLTGSGSGSNYSFVDISSNNAELGGGVYAINANVISHLAEVHDNHASYGGGFDLDSSLLTMTQSEVHSNTSIYDGGGLLLINAAKADVDASTIADNTAGRYGAGIFATVNELNVINSTISGNLAGSYGGGIFFTGQDSLNLTYSTIANNIANTNDTSGVTNAGGGVYQITGTFNMVNTILAQNYQTSVSVGSHDDYYASSSVKAGSITYSIIGENNIPEFFTGEKMIVIDSTHPYSDLGVSTVLENLGGPTRTLWISNSSMAIGAGTPLDSITVDQRGIDRSLTAPTIGAYEKNIVTYVFNDTGDHDIYNIDNWIGFTGASPDFFIADAIYQIADGTAMVTTARAWDVGSHSSVTVINDSTLNINNGATMSSQDITVESTATMIIAGTLTYSTDRLGSANTSLKVNDYADLTINTQDDNIANVDISLGSGWATTVQYTYTDPQTVRDLANYGHVVISNSGSKNAAADLTIYGSLKVNSGATFNAGTYDVRVVGLTTTDAVIIEDASFTSSGALNVDNNDVAISNSSVTADSLSVYLGDVTLTSSNISASSINVYNSGNMTLNSGTVIASSLVVDGDLGAIGDNTTSKLTAPLISVGSFNVSGTNTRFDVDYVSTGFSINDSGAIVDSTIHVAADSTLSLTTTGNAALDFDNITDNTILGTLEVHAGTINPINQAKLNGSLAA